MDTNQLFAMRLRAGDLLFTPKRNLLARELLSAAAVSKRQAQRIFSEGRIRVDGRALQAGDMLYAGDEVVLSLATPLTETLDTTRAPYKIRAFDPFFLAVEKPAGMLVHSDGSLAPNLTDELADFLHAQGAPLIPQAIQRLDVDTTGLVIFSLHEEFQATFDALVAGTGLHKSYLAIVEGAFPQTLTHIDASLGRDRHDAHRMRISPSGKVAHTRVKLLQVRGQLSLLQLELLTGRRHQIRVHLASVGHPIVGDTLYGSPAHTVGQPASYTDGLMLHAFREEFIHPLSGKHITVTTAFPKRFARLGFSTA